MTAMTDTPPAATASRRTAVLDRVATPRHLCPSGLKSHDLLCRRGFEVEDHRLTSRAERDAFEVRFDVGTTPQARIGGERMDGHDALHRRFDLAVPDRDAVTSAPIVAIVGMALAVALSWAMRGALAPGLTIWWVLGLATTLLAVQKLRDVEAFTNGVPGYDLPARREVRYAYPRLGAGVGVPVVKAVHVERRDLGCACVGGGATVPPGFISLPENVAMIGMGLWMVLAASGAVPMPL